jgi:hypothetical protein
MLNTIIPLQYQRAQLCHQIVRELPALHHLLLADK